MSVLNVLDARGRDECPLANLVFHKKVEDEKYAQAAMTTMRTSSCNPDSGTSNCTIVFGLERKSDNLGYNDRRYIGG